MNIAVLASRLPPLWRIRLERIFDRYVGYRLRTLQNCPRVTSGFLYRGALLHSHADKLADSGVIFDVGAHIGETSLAFALEFPGVPILAFEPVETTFRRLEHNCRGFPNITCHQLALGDSEEDRCIQLRSADSLCSMNQMNRLASEQTPVDLRCTIHLTTIDKMVDKLEINHIAILKVDVEGYELDVLRGARQTLAARKISSVMAEVTFSRGSTQHVHINDLTSLLSEAGFELIGYYDPAYYSNNGALYYANALYQLKKDAVG